jgi:hypothetical protein
MANTNPQAVTFTNTRYRPLTDLAISYYLSCKKFVQEWTAQTLANVIPNDAVVISDAASTGGSTPVTDGDVNIMFAQAQSFIALMEGATAAPVNNSSFQNFNQILKGQVNGKAIF